MFAVVEVAGKQFIVEPGKVIIVDQLDAIEGSELELDKVVMLNDNSKVTLGTPFVAGAKVKAKILNHQRGDKIRVFKMKAKKRYRKTFGHRSYQTRLEIVGVNA